MAKCKNCEPETICDPLISTKCIIWDGSKIEQCTFEELIEYLYKEANKSGKHTIDIKTLSELTGLTRDQIIQILIDQIIKLKLEQIKPHPLDNCDLDLTIIGSDCSDCQSLCSKLQIMLGEIASLRSRIETLESLNSI